MVTVSDIAVYTCVLTILYRHCHQIMAMLDLELSIILVMCSLSHVIYPDPTLTLDNLLTVLERVTNWKGLGLWLGVPPSRRDVMTGKESMLREWLDNHPAPSWELLAWALYMKGGGQLTEHSVLKHHLYGRYVTGMSMVVYCGNVFVFVNYVQVHVYY